MKILHSKCTLKLQFILLFLIGLIDYTHAQTIYYSKASGNFDTFSTWALNSDGSGAEPTAISGNHFVILAGHTVTIPADETESIHTLEVEGTLTMNENAILQISNDYYYYQSGRTTLDPTSLITFNNSSNVSVLEGRNTTGTSRRLEFSNLSFDKGGNKVIVNNTQMDINGDFSLANTEFESNDNILVSGNVTIDASSKYSTETGTYIFMDGSGDQRISVPTVVNMSSSGSTVAQFSNVRFSNGGNNSISDGFYSDGTVEVYKQDGATLSFDNGDYSLRSLRVRDTQANSGTALYFNGGNVYINNSSTIDHYFSGDDDQVGTLDIGTVNFIAETADLYIGGSHSNGDNITFTGNITVNDNRALLLRANTVLNSNGGTLEVTGTSRVYIEGSNTPSFGTYTISELSTFYYRSTTDVTLMPIEYGHLRLYYASNKTVDNDMTIKGNLGVYYEANFNVNAGNTVEIYGNIENIRPTDNGEPGTINATDATITMKMGDINRYINIAKDLSGGADNIYTITNFNIEVASELTSIRTFSIYNKLDIDNLTISNATGSTATQLLVDLRDESFDVLDVSTNITQQDFTKIRTRSTTSPFLTPSGTVDIDQTSAFVEFIGSNQTIPAISYGNVQLNGSGNKTLAGNITIKGRIERTGGTVYLIAGTNTISISGDWMLNNSGTAYHNGISQSTVIFEGTNDQAINDATFGNITINTIGNVTIARPITILGDISLNGGDDATLLNVISNENIDLYGDWAENTTSKFSQSNHARVRLLSTTDDQTISQNPLSEFNHLTLEKKNSACKTVFNTKVTIAGDLRLESTKGQLEINDDLTLKGHYYNLGSGNSFTQAPDAQFNLAGSSVQYFRVDDANESTFTELVTFSGEGMKNFHGTSIYTFEKGVSISGSTVDASNRTLNIKGDWLNNNGLFESSGTVNFNGGKAQVVQPTTFYRFSIQENGTIVNLNGSISIYQLLQDANTTLNTNGNAISCASTWTGDGTFVHGNGSVTFSGQSSSINESDPFYNLSSTLTEDQTLSFSNDLVVLNDLSVSLNSRFDVNAHNLTIGGDLLSDGDIYDITTLTFNGSDAGRTYTIKNGLKSGSDNTPADNSHIDIIISPSVNATYQLMSNFRMTNTRGDLTINAGKFDLNGYSLEQTNNNKQVIVKDGAELIVSAGSALQLTGSDAQPTLHGEANSTISLVGDDNNYALVEGHNSTNSYQILIDGTLSARNYKITDLRGYGLQFGANSSLAAAPNNLTNGIFVNGINSSEASITIASGATLGATTIENVTFGLGPDYAVDNNSSTIGDITFYNSKGSNKTIENDTPDKIEWTFDSFIQWSGASSTDWHTGSNWVGGVVPVKANNIVIPTGLTNYPVLDVSTGVANRIEIQDGATLTVEERLEAYDGIFINDGGSLIGSASNGDSIIVFGDWVNEEDFTANTSPIRITQEDGTTAKLLSFIPGTDTYPGIVIDGKEHTVLQSDNTLNVTNLTIKSGIYDVSDTDIKVYGDWKKEGGTFEFRTSDLISEGATIYGGDFYNLLINSGTKTTLAGNITVNNRLDLVSSSSIFDANKYLIYQKGEFDNSEGGTITHSGTIIFNGAYQNIRGNATFSNVIFQGSSSKNFVSGTNITITNDLTVLDGIAVILNAGSTLSGSGVFTMTGGTVYVRDVSNYPTGFEQYQITGGSFFYDEGTQDIGDFEYYNLLIDDGTKTLRGNVRVSNLLRLYADNTEVGVLDVNGFELGIGNAFDVDERRAEADQTDVITWNSGTLRHYGGYWSMPNEIKTYHNLILDGVSSKVLFTDIDINGDFEINDGVYFYQGRSDQYYTVTGTSGGELKMGENARWYVYPDPDGDAFATDFGSYNVASTSHTFIYTPFEEECIVNTDVSYGNLYLRDEGYVDLDENLIVLGTLDERLNEEEAFDINSETIFVGGNLIVSTIDFRNGGAIHLNGNTEGSTQRLDLLVEGMALPNLILSGVTQKQFVTDDYLIERNITMQDNADVYISRDFEFKGETWTSDNTTTLVSYADLTINSEDDPQTINFGSNHTIRRLYFVEDELTTINCSLNVDNELVNTGGQVDFGSFTHNIAASIFTLESTDITTNANFNLDGGTQYLPLDFSVNNLTLSVGGSKVINGDLTAYDITALDNAALIPQNAASTITVKGNWDFELGRYSTKEAKVIFDGAIANEEYTIYQDGRTRMFEVQFMGTNNNTYKLTDELYTYTDVNIESGATVDINGHLLYVGARTEIDDYPSLTGNLVEDLNIRGELLISKGGSVQLNARDGDGTENPTVTVENGGHLSIVGEEGLLSKLSATDRGSDDHRLVVKVESGAKISAKFYEFRDLDHVGLYVDKDATVDAVKNFSEGVFAGMSRDNNLGEDRIYLHLDAEVSATISNVTFDYNGNPNPAYNLYNVKRLAYSPTKGVINFEEGTGMKGDAFEYDEDQDNGGSGLINWPDNTDIYWEGNTSTDWFDASNWNPSAAVPTANDNVIITSKVSATTFYPVISGSVKAICDDLIIQGGRLTVESSVTDASEPELEVSGDLQLESGLINIDDDQVIDVGENYTVSNEGSFVAANGIVKLTKSTGTIVVDQANSNFNDLEISEGGTVALQTYLTVDGAFSIPKTGGIVLPNNHNVVLNGDIQLSTTASFDTQSDGWVYLRGEASQNLKNATFKRVRFQGTEYVVEDSLIITSRAYLDKGTLKQLNGSSSYVFNSLVYVENDDFFIELSDEGGTHYLRNADWYGYGTTSNLTNPSGNGYSNFVFQALDDRIDIRGDKAFFDSVSLETDLLVMYADLELTTLDASNAHVYAYEKQLTGSHNGEFTLGASKYLYLTAADNFPIGFGSYSFDTESRTYYAGGLDQTIHTKEEVRDESNTLLYKLPIIYGDLYLEREGSVKTISDEGELIVRRNLLINQATLNTNDKNIKIGKDLYHQYLNSNLIYGTSKFTFDGDEDQRLYLSNVRDNNFYDINVNKPDNTTLSVSGSDLTIEGDLVVQNGIFSLGGRTATLKKNLLVNNGSLNEYGTYYMDASGTGAIIRTNNSKFRGLRINGKKTTVYRLLDDLTISDNYDLELVSGKLNTANATINIGHNGQFNVGANGSYIFGESGRLIMGNNSTLNVEGNIDVVGTSSIPAIIQSSRTGYYYSFNVEGNINARYYNISDLSTNGIFVKNTATIDNQNLGNNFSDGTFTNYLTGGVALKIENNQSFVANFDGSDNYIDGGIANVNFIQDALRGTANISKESSTTGRIDFYNANGQLSGSNYERDPENLINWYGPNTYVWTGEEDDDWFNANNWSSSNGGIPTAGGDVIIGPTTNQPIIDDGGVAVANNLTLNTASLLIINSSDSDDDLVINGNVELNGQIRMESENDGISFKANWIINPTGSFKHGGGQLTANGAGAQQIDNAGLDFGVLTIGETSVSTLNLNGEEDIQGDFTVTSSASLELNATLKTLSISGNVSVLGSIITNGNTLRLIGDGDATADVFTLNIPLSSNVIDVLDIDTDDSSDEYQLSSNLYVSDRFDLHSGTFDLNGNTFYFKGDVTNKMDIDGGTIDLTSSTLVMDNGTIFELNDGSLIMGEGARVTSENTSSDYSFSLLGGNFSGELFTFEYMDEEGIVFNGVTLGSNSTPIDHDNDPGTADVNYNVLLPFGLFQNGQANGRLIDLASYSFASGSNPVAGSSNLENKFYSLFFNRPSTTNVRNRTGSTVYFSDAKGGISGDNFEDETSGSIEWEATKDVYTWVGDVDDLYKGHAYWTNPANWVLNGGGEPTVYPGEEDEHANKAVVIIPQPEVGNNPPVLLNTKKVTIYSLRVEPQAGMIIEAAADPSALDRSDDNNYEIIIKDEFSILSNGIQKGYVDFIRSLVRVEGRIQNDGIFKPESSIMVLKPASGEEINLAAGENYNDLYIDGTNDPIINLTGDVNVQGLFNMDDGTLNVGTNTLNVKGDFVLASAVNLNYEDDFTLVLDSADQTLTINNHNLRNIKFGGTGTKTISNSLTIEGDFTIEGNRTTVAFGTNSLELKGNWVNEYGNGNFTMSDPGTVTFSGTSIQTLSSFSGEETFTTMIVNNASGIDSELDLTISNGLTLTNGILKAPHVILEAGVGGDTGISSSESSFVYGKVTAKDIPQATISFGGSLTWYQFPIGSQSTWARAAINTENVGGTYDYTVEYTTEDRGSSLLIADGGDGVSMEVSQFIWNITNGSSNAHGIHIRLYLEDLSPFDLADDVNLRKLIHYYDKEEGDGINWYEEETSNTFGTDGASSYVEARNIQKFSDFGATLELSSTDDSSDLPVELTYFDGSIDEEGNVLLEWETASEANASHFDIERSFNGQAFEKIGTVEANGNTNVAIQYSFEDTIDSRIVFYRLKQVDFDDQFAYHGPVTLVNESDIEATENLELFAYPNPMEGDKASVTIRGLLMNESFEGQIMTLTGQSVYTVSTEADDNGISKLDLNISDWKTGVYILKIKTGSGKTAHLKLMK